MKEADDVMDRIYKKLKSLDEEPIDTIPWIPWFNKRDAEIVRKALDHPPQ